MLGELEVLAVFTPVTDFRVFTPYEEAAGTGVLTAFLNLIGLPPDDGFFPIDLLKVSDLSWADYAGISMPLNSNPSSALMSAWN